MRDLNLNLQREIASLRKLLQNLPASNINRPGPQPTDPVRHGSSPSGAIGSAVPVPGTSTQFQVPHKTITRKSFSEPAAIASTLDTNVQNRRSPASATPTTPPDPEDAKINVIIASIKIPFDHPFKPHSSRPQDIDAR
ncbi:g2828 [Coccomyxa elongata]